MAWTNPNTLNTPITPAWGDETRQAILMYEGLSVSSAIGTTITFSTPFGNVSEYGVEFFWQEDPGPNSGELYPIKSVGSCIIRNKGTEYGKVFLYRIKKVITAP